MRDDKAKLPLFAYYDSLLEHQYCLNSVYPFPKKKSQMINDLNIQKYIIRKYRTSL